jgi:acetoin utilization deacetylase AcuC-like enzyme
MARGWPLDEPKIDPQGRPNPSFVPSDVDVPIDRGEEGRYNPALAEALERLAALPLPGGAAVADLAIVVAGADPYEADELPSARLLRLTRAQMLERDQQIYRFLTGKAVPAAFLMSGGYGPHSWEVFAQFLEWVLPLRLAAAGADG